jgi:phosphonopyruvate decarboxylase
MIRASDFLAAAKRRRLDMFSGVPCSFLTPLINGVIDDGDVRYVGATSEGEAVAIAAGAWLAGRRTAVMCQNSGLGNTINPLTSLNWPFRIPTLLIVTWRGEPGLGDEPQHELMGRITGRLLDDVEVPHRPFPSEVGELEDALDGAVDAMDETGRPYAFIMAKDTVADQPLMARQPSPAPVGEQVDLVAGGPRPRRIEALERVLAEAGDDVALVASTGYCGRELFTLADREQHLYMVGSMGGASALGLGAALVGRRRVVVLDGDGAALMKLGNLATIGAQQPERLVHVILDNGVHESTGGQATVSAGVDFASIAVACGYRQAVRADSLGGFATALATALAAPGPSLIHLRIAPGTRKPLARPTVSPVEVARRFRRFLTSQVAGEPQTEERLAP